MRLREIMEACKKNSCSFTDDELSQIVVDAKVLFTPECATLVKMLVKQIRGGT